MYAILPRESKKFTEKLAECIISEHTSHFLSCSSSDNEFFNPPNPYKQKNFDYVYDMVNSKNPVSKNLIKIYD